MAPQSMHTPKAAMNNQLGSGYGRLAPELFVVPRVVRPKRCAQKPASRKPTSLTSGFFTSICIVVSSRSYFYSSVFMR